MRNLPTYIALTIVSAIISGLSFATVVVIFHDLPRLELKLGASILGICIPCSVEVVNILKPTSDLPQGDDVNFFLSALLGGLIGVIVGNLILFLI